MNNIDLTTKTETNQQGQTLGRKGTESRKRLMAAARKLLKSYSPGELTAAAIAKEAKTSPASFYMYFEDTRDVLFALAAEATADMSKVYDVVAQDWDPDSLHEHVSQLLDAFWTIWDAHRDVLRYRNLEADRGDPRFEELRMSMYVPFIDQFGRQMIAACPEDRVKPTLSQAFALSSLMHASIERHASTDPAVVGRWMSPGKLHDAITHMVETMFRAGRGPLVADAPKARAKAAGTRKTKAAADPQA